MLTLACINCMDCGCWVLMKSKRLKGEETHRQLHSRRLRETVAALLSPTRPELNQQPSAVAIVPGYNWNYEILLRESNCMCSSSGSQLWYLWSEYSLTGQKRCLLSSLCWVREGCVSPFASHTLALQNLTIKFLLASPSFHCRPFFLKIKFYNFIWRTVSLVSDLSQVY